ncbi:DUF6602 domain-containing protein [Pseudomonas aeruginosa]|uniref:DUF6602 domain-containing protein n=1 Tax=Pseudomonas aeruginosa TaxID=287 RepID=UPI0031B6A16B
MSHYFDHVSQELHSKIAQAKVYITKHNPSTGALAEAVLRQFLKEHLPGGIGVEQGFIADASGNLSKQCDILIYDAHLYAPLYRAGGVVVVPVEAIIAIVEVKTSINRRAFHDVISYFRSFENLALKAKTYLFMFNAPTLGAVSRSFRTYRHPGEYQEFDWDTFQFLPDEITGLNHSYHLQKGQVIHERDAVGYLSYFYKDSEGTEINALERFFLSVYAAVEQYLETQLQSSARLAPRSAYHNSRPSHSIFAIDLFPM